MALEVLGMAHTHNLLRNGNARADTFFPFSPAKEGSWRPDAAKSFPIGERKTAVIASAATASPYCYQNLELI